jgi:HK97 family phage prohead protease
MKPNHLPERESRFLSASVELRAAAETEKPPIVRGYAAKFDVESEIMATRSGESFVEVIARGAFDDVLNDDIRALINHDPNLVLARSKNGVGSLKVGTDEIGLFYEFEIPDTQIGRDLKTSIERGDIDQSSFGFIIKEEKFEKRANGMIQRTINKVRQLLDVSAVTYPAYPDATVALRSIQEFQAETTPKKPSQEEISEVSDWAARLGN